MKYGELELLRVRGRGVCVGAMGRAQSSCARRSPLGVVGAEAHFCDARLLYTLVGGQVSSWRAASGRTRPCRHLLKGNGYSHFSLSRAVIATYSANSWSP